MDTHRPINYMDTLHGDIIYRGNYGNCPFCTTILSVEGKQVVNGILHESEKKPLASFLIIRIFMAILMQLFCLLQSIEEQN